MKKYVDMHCDTLLCTITDGKDDMYSLPGGMLDIRRLKEAGALAQFFAIFFPAPSDELMKELDTDEKYFQALYHTFRNTLEKNSDLIRFAGNYEDVVRNEKDGRVSAFLTLEDGRMIQNDLARLQEFYQKGVRLITLTWNFENCFGYPNAKDPQLMNLGLKPFGKEAVEEMNRLGMLIDVSHLSDGGFYDVAKISKKPFVASHSNCRSLCPHQRNLTDDMIRVLAQKGGVAGLNIAGHFLNRDITDDHGRIESMVEHVLYMTKLGGEDFVAIGTDFDGVGGQLDIDEPGKLELLFEALKKAGFSERQLDKLAWGNAMRVIREAL
ncbi:MAG: dipeptidase [Eubacteriales bacterium]|nr:dipeptidase [Eubacteriales bacterium]